MIIRAGWRAGQPRRNIDAVDQIERSSIDFYATAAAFIARIALPRSTMARRPMRICRISKQFVL